MASSLLGAANARIAAAATAVPSRYRIRATLRPAVSGFKFRIPSADTSILTAVAEIGTITREVEIEPAQEPIPTPAPAEQPTREPEPTPA